MRGSVKIIVVVYLLILVVFVFYRMYSNTDKPGGAIDFPCFIGYRAKDRCVENFAFVGEIEEGKRIQAFIDVKKLGYMGAGCHTYKSDTDVVRLKEPAASLKLVRQGDLLYVNGKEMPVMETLTITNYRTPNAWLVEKIEFINVGVVSICGSKTAPQLILIGTSWNEVSLTKGIVLLVISLAMVVGIAILIY